MAVESFTFTVTLDPADMLFDSLEAMEMLYSTALMMVYNQHIKILTRNQDKTVGACLIMEASAVESSSNGPNAQQPADRKPCRIEIVGVVCDPCLAVARGIRRVVVMGRAVRVNLQLGSHKRFASAFSTYAELADSAKLYSTNAIGGPPQLIAWKSGTSKLLVEPEEFKLVKLLSNLNNDAESVYELYKGDPNPLYEPGSAWKDIVMLPSRPDTQLQLKTAIEKLEAHKEQCIHPSSN